MIKLTVLRTDKNDEDSNLQVLPKRRRWPSMVSA